jgi:hypothetical protein
LLLAAARCGEVSNGTGVIRSFIFTIADETAQKEILKVFENLWVTIPY